RLGVSPGGVTTSVDAPPHSTEEEYFQACHAAKTWMQDRRGDPHELFEAYLAAVQAPHVSGPGTWNVPWEVLSPARQAAVIVAARAATADECG
ncbi:MAG TPA: lipoprotein LpqV, partial [Mycobacterium sp.]